METIHLTTTIDADGTLHIDAPTGLPPGQAEVLVVINLTSQRAKPTLSWHDAVGLGKEIWEGIDAQEYVNQLRDEWEK
jgi:hypothetical protein